MDQCGECGYVYGSVASGDIPDTLRAIGDRYRDAILDPALEGLVRIRPAPDVWSALEYACHVRDVLLIQRDRAILALVEDTPSYAPMHRDERVLLAGYEKEQVAEVASELVMAANLMAKLFEGLSPEQLTRPCIYNYPEPTERDLSWLGQHTVHEATHHFDDLESVLGRVSSP
ncbi:MAG TPA: DinB family protein [Acidimicrobiales bacterium]